MISFLRHYEIDKEKWDACIENSRYPLIYGYSWYLDLIAPDWCAMINKDYSSLMPLPLRTKMGMEYVFQPLFAQQLGVFSIEEVNSFVLKEFIGNIPSNIKYIDTNLNITNPAKELPYTLTKRTNYELDISGKAEDMFNNYSSNTTRNIKKSKSLICIDENVTVEELIRLKKENTSPIRPARFYEWMDNFSRQLIQRNHAKIFGAKVDGKVVAAALFGIDDHRIYYLIPISDKVGKELRAMFAIIDYVIASYAGSEKILDFEGSDIQGVARFFDGFGAKAVNYYKLKINRLPLLLRLFKK